MASSSASVLSAPKLGAVSTAPSTSPSFSVECVDLLSLWKTSPFAWALRTDMTRAVVSMLDEKPSLALLEIAYTDGTACRTDLPLDGLGAERRDLHANVAKLVACRAYDWLHIGVANSLIRADAVHKIVSEAEQRK